MNSSTARYFLALVITVIAALVAAGCGGTAKGDGADSKPASTSKLGLKSKNLCVVGTGDSAIFISTTRVNDLADMLEDVVEDSDLDGTDDIEDLKVSDYEGDLDPQQALAVDLLIRHAIYEHEMNKKKLTLKKDAVDDELDDLADELNLDDADELIDRLEEDSGLDEDTYRAGIQADLNKEELYDDLDSDEADEFDDSDEYGEELVEAYDEKGLVKCAKVVTWTEDVDPTLEGDDVEVDIKELIGNSIAAALNDNATLTDPPSTTTTTTQATTPSNDVDATLQAKRYDNAVKPLLSSTGAVVLRFTRSSQKLTGGSISIKSLINAYKEQSADMKRIVRLSGRVNVQDGYLMKNHRTFRQAVGQMDKAIALMASIDQLRTEAALNARLKAVTAAVKESDRLFTKWHDGLQADPKGRDYPKIDSEWLRLTSLLEAAS